MKLKMMAASDTGTTRAVNEDFCGIFEEQGLAIVCDGMGGHVAGANASRLAVTTMRYMYLFLDPEIHDQLTRDLIVNDLAIASRLAGAIRLTNRNIYKKSLQEPELRGMGTTVSALAIQNNVAIIAHVGDSRIYRLRQGSIKLLTEDHTWINELIQDQELDREAAQKFEKKNVITRALGLNGTIKIDISIVPVERGDLFLICTDGLTKALSDHEIKRIVLFNSANLDHALRHLIDTAMMKDGSDNITVALVAIEELEPISANLPPTYFTLKAENKQETLLEDKILKRELKNRTHAESPEKALTKIIKDHYGKLTGTAALVMVVIFLGMYATSSHLIGSKSSRPKELAATVPVKDHIRDTLVAPATLNNQMNFDPARPALQIESKAVPDSIVSKVIATALDDRYLATQVPNIKSRSLKKINSDRGKIFLTGLEKTGIDGNTSLFLNDQYRGRTEDIMKIGLSLQPGTYTISIRDSTDQILFQQTNIVVSAGDIKAIEVKGR